MFCQFWRQPKKWLAVSTTKISLCWSLVVHYQTWLTIAYTKLPMQNSIPSLREIQTYWERNREDAVDDPSFFCTRKAIVVETFSLKPTNICKSIVAIDASELYPYSMCQPMSSRLCTRWDLDPETNRLPHWHNNPIFTEQDLKVKVKAFLQLADKRKMNQRRWVLFSLQHCDGSHGFLSLTLYQWSSTSIFNWIRYSMWL